MEPCPESAILDAWRANAAPWTAAVRGGAIESRVRVTDRAVVDAVLAASARVVLDVGCGEGWLARALGRHDLRVVGVDATAALIDRAREAGGGEFLVGDYDAVADGRIDARADTAVCNFSLIGREPVERLLAALPARLDPPANLIVQTLHPVAACGDAPYADGWREGSWAGCGDGFGDAAPWYFRTVESWRTLIEASGFALRETIEPALPGNRAPASILFVARASRR